MLQPKKPVKVVKKSTGYVPTAKEKKNLEDATQMKNMRPTGPTGPGRLKPTLGSAKKGKTVKKAFLGSLLGGMGSNLLGGAIGGMFGGGGGSSTKLQQNNAKLNMPSLSGSMKKGGKMKKAQKGTSLGMKSVKAGVDKNPGVTRADIITAATKKAKSGASMKKCKYGCK